MQPESLDQLFNGPFRVGVRPLPIAGDLRLSWGLALVLLILGYSRGSRASFQKIHFLAHSARSVRLQNEASELLRSDATLLVPSIRVEPWVNRAVAFAHGFGLADASAGKAVQLTPAGEELFKQIQRDSSILPDEQKFLGDISPTASEAKINRAMRMENSAWA